ncbi:MAG TPA: hypothetical protein VFW16_12150 [Streptosporangiaceae bacterium]|nr:hypothetical protein [Streptosporangiaceae bacterium]
MAETIARQNGLISRAQALSCGLTHQALRYRIRAGGPWQVLVPGVYATFTGALTRDQKEIAALLYAGRGSVITGQAAMAAHGVSNRGRRVVDVLIPAGSHRRDHNFVHVLRTARMPTIVFMTGELRYVPVARAVADAARQSNDMNDVRSLVAAAVQLQKVTVAELAAEAGQGPAAGSARLRAALAEVADGVRSVAEADLRKLIKRSGLPDPLYNPWLYSGEEFIARPDAWWPDEGVVVEVDSREWHLSPADWKRTMARHSRMSALGISVLHYPPSKIVAEPRAVIAEIRAALDMGRERPPVPIRTVRGR